MKRLAFAVALLALACGAPAATQTAAPVPTPTAAPADPIAVVLADFKIEPSAVTSETLVAFNVANDGPTPHNLTVRDSQDAIVLASAELREGETDEVTAQLTPGEYTTFCSLPGHESLGMRGTLTVNP
jgi:plastocyanin